MNFDLSLCQSPTLRCFHCSKQGTVPGGNCGGQRSEVFEELQEENMEKGEQERLRITVGEILAEIDIEEVSAKQVREMAAQRTGLDLSSRECKKFVSNVIKQVLDSVADASDAEAGVPNPKVPVAREEAELEEGSRNKSSKKMKISEDAKDNEDIHDQVHEEDAEEDAEGASGEGNKPMYEKDEEGNIIICELSAKRKVVVSEFRGKTLISVREYYERDGKVLPTAKGISLTAEQFEVLATSAKDVEAAISSFQ